jgi:hypothetical protein
MAAVMSKRGIPAPRPEPQRANRARSVAELLPEVGGVAFRKFGFVQSAVVTRWPEIVGARYARVSAPESIRFPAGQRSGGTLNLVVRGAFAGVMQHITPEIVERVNRFFGYAAIVKVAIRQGDVIQTPPPATAPVTRSAVPEPSGSVRAIADPELRSVLAALAAGVAGSAGLPTVGNRDE